MTEATIPSRALGLPLFKPTSLEGFAGNTRFRPELTGADYGRTVPPKRPSSGRPELVSSGFRYDEAGDEDFDVEVRVLPYRTVDERIEIRRCGWVPEIDDAETGMFETGPEHRHGSGRPAQAMNQNYGLRLCMRLRRAPGQDGAHQCREPARGSDQGTGTSPAACLSRVGC